VLIQDAPAAAGTRVSRERRDTADAETSRGPEPRDASAGVRAVVSAVATAGGLEIECEIDEGESALLVQLTGEGCPFFYGEDGKGEPLRALEYLLQRTFGEVVRPRVLRLRCEGFRERRDLALGEEARALAAEVRTSGEAHSLEPMNAYDRRIVHLALQEEPGVRNYSVGEGSERRVTIAPASPSDAAGDPGDADGR